MSANVLVRSCALGLTNFCGCISHNVDVNIEDALVMAVRQIYANPFKLESKSVKDKLRG